MKRLIFLLCLSPALASGQRFEFALQGGISGNLVPPSLKDGRQGLEDPQYFHTGGLNPVIQASAYCFIQQRFKLGPTFRYFSTSAEATAVAPGSAPRTGKLSGVILQLLSECDYRFVDRRKFTFDAGVVGGPSIHIIDNTAALNRWGDTPGRHSETGFVIGLNFTGRYMLSDRISVNVSANPIYNMLSAPEEMKVQYGSNRNFSTLCLPVTAGLGMVL